MAIIHDTDNNQFTPCRQGLDSVLQCRWRHHKGSVDFYRTWVPPVLRGHGHAACLAGTGLAWFREQKLNIDAASGYAARRLADESRAVWNR